MQCRDIPTSKTNMAAEKSTNQRRFPIENVEFPADGSEASVGFSEKFAPWKFIETWPFSLLIKTNPFFRISLENHFQKYRLTSHQPQQEETIYQYHQHQLHLHHLHHHSPMNMSQPVPVNLPFMSGMTFPTASVLGNLDGRNNQIIDIFWRVKLTFAPLKLQISLKLTFWNQSKMDICEKMVSIIHFG